jgi:hypothetical protein
VQEPVYRLTVAGVVGTEKGLGDLDGLLRIAYSDRPAASSA